MSMTKGRGKGRGNWRDQVVAKMDEHAIRLLDGMNDVTVGSSPSDAPVLSHTAQLDTFKAVGTWVGIKNRLQDAANEPGDLNELRQQLRRREAASRSRKTIGRAFAQRATLPDGDGGSALDAIKRRIPDANAGDDDGAGNGTEH